MEARREKTLGREALGREGAKRVGRGGWVTE